MMPFLRIIVTAYFLLFSLIHFCFASDSSDTLPDESSEYGQSSKDISFTQKCSLPPSSRSRIYRNDLSGDSGHKTKRRGSKEGIQQEPIESRASRFFDDGGIVTEYSRSSHYRIQDAFFVKALRLSIDELGGVYQPDHDPYGILRTVFMDKVRDFYHHDMLTKGTERYRREENLDMTLEEFDLVRKHFLNQNPPEMEGSTPLRRRRRAKLRSYYRKQWMDPTSDKEKLKKLMERNKFTMEDIKPYVLPPVKEIREYLAYLRSSTHSAENEKEAPMMSYTTNRRVHHHGEEARYESGETSGSARLDLDLNELALERDPWWDVDQQDQGYGEEEGLPYDQTFHDSYGDEYGSSSNQARSDPFGKSAAHQK